MEHMVTQFEFKDRIKTWLIYYSHELQLLIVGVCVLCTYKYCGKICR